jgi:nucleotidyltransferase substrate binding protein (TIGR01987 family)
MMMSNEDIRWVQRFNNYTKALDQLTKFMERDSLNKLEEQGLIQSFEYNHELAWKTLKDFLEYKGKSDLFGSRDVSREAFKSTIWIDALAADRLQAWEIWKIN